MISYSLHQKTGTVNTTRSTSARHYKRIIGQAIFLLCNITFSAAQKEVRFERITVDDGLSQSSVTAVIQDKYGYLWISTLDGVNRYDGSRFKIYRNTTGHENSLYANRVHKLFLDRKQNLWLSYSGAIGRYNPRTDNFTNFPITIAGETATRFVTHDLDPVTDSVALLSTNDGIIEFNLATGAAKKPAAYSFFRHQNISSIFITPGAGTWVITLNNVYVKFPDSAQWVGVLEDNAGVDGLYSEATDEIYLQTRTRLLKFDPGTRSLGVVDQFRNEADFDFSHYGMEKLSNGELWITRRSIHIYDKNDQYRATLKSIPQNKHSLSGDLLSCIYETKDNVIWVGTNGFGLNKCNPALSVFKYLGTYYGVPLTLSDNYVDAVYTADDTHIMVGTIAGLDIIDLKNNTSRHFSLTGRDNMPARINRIFRDRHDNTWLCTTKGLRHFDGRRIRFSGLAELDSADLCIYDLTETAPGRYVLATTKGIYAWQPEKAHVVKTYPYGSIPVGSLNGEPWIETDKEIRIMNTDGSEVLKTFKKGTADTSAFPMTSVKCFHADAEGRMWTGSWGGGLGLYDPATGRFRLFREEAGLPNSVVYGILEDSTGNLWLSTNKGICVFNKEQKRSIRNFDRNDGLQGNEFNTRAYFRSASGTFYFGGTHGLTYFDPAEALQIRSFIPKSVLTGFFINNIRTDRVKHGNVVDQYNIANSNIVLDWSERNFAFELAGLGFTFPSRTRFRYMLENFDRSWNFMDDERRISFTNIPPGSYTLRVKSSNSFGDWEDEGLAIGIVVNAPFWRTPWFTILCVLSFSAAIYTVYYRRTAVLKKRAMQLALLVNERTREIQLKNEEIAAQNEEITAQNEELATQSETLLMQNKELASIKTSLEEKVEERTLTLQNMNKKLVEQNTRLEQFTFITAHNIRGPVAQIQGLVKLLPQTGSEEMAHLNGSVKNLDEVISDLNTVLNIRHGVDHSFEAVQLKDQLLRAIQTLTDDIRKKDAIVHTAHFEDVTVNGIKPYFYSIFYNLIHNALKYSDPARKPVITCSCKNSDKKVRIAIEDNGIGIDMRYAKAKIFNLYQRFRPEIKGKGFGLFLIKTQVETMGGRIEVESALNKGTTFIINFEGR